MWDFRLQNDRHTGGSLVSHPRRKMGASAVRLLDDQIRLAAVVVKSKDDDPLATTWVKRIPDDHILVMTMGSVLWVR
ncbi:hypothetical protein BurMR1_3688, partial [Burkholderia sp. MR1]